MKKLLFFIVFMLVTTIAQAENTSWIKGGLSFFDGEHFCADSNPALSDEPQERCGNKFDEKNFFVQVSPINVRGKFNGSKLGYRLEPWMGYSQTGNTDTDGAKEDIWLYQGTLLVEYDQVKLTNLSVKNFQLGTNLFLDYEVLPDLTIYGGPVAGFEISQISAEATHYFYERLSPDGDEFDETIEDGHYNTSEWVSNFIYGAEIGGEYKITKNVALGAFAGFLQHGTMFDGESESKWDQDVEIRAGTGLTFYW